MKSKLSLVSAEEGEVGDDRAFLFLKGPHPESVDMVKQCASQTSLPQLLI